MEMVDMDITQFGFFGPTTRSVNIFPASKSWICFDVGFVYFEKMTFLDLFDMYLMFFDTNSKYLVGFSQYLVKNHQLSLVTALMQLDCLGEVAGALLSLRLGAWLLHAAASRAPLPRRHHELAEVIPSCVEQTGAQIRILEVGFWLRRPTCSCLET